MYSSSVIVFRCLCILLTLGGSAVKSITFDTFNSKVIMADLSFECLKTQAEILGLKGDDITKYLITQQNFAREERAREREEREREREERVKEREREKKELRRVKLRKLSYAWR